MKTTRLLAVGLISIVLVVAVCAGPNGTTTAAHKNAVSALVPHIAVRPASTVHVGQEVLFDALGTVYTDTQMLLKGRYEWDFGDDQGH